MGRLEDAIAKRLGRRHAIAVCNGTSALHLALLALNIGPGDEVVFPSYVCAALLHAVHYTGARPVLCDIHGDTLNPTTDHIRPRLTRRTKAIIVTHTFGFPADILPILQFGVPVIEDCAQALGATIDGRPVGSIGHMAVCSLYATKVVCAGEGGVVCTDNSRWADRVRGLTKPDEPPHRYEVRYNYKLSDLAAGLAFKQIGRLDAFIRRRRAIADRYRRAFAGIPNVTFQVPLPGSEPIYYRFLVRTSRARSVIETVGAKGVTCDQPVFRPAHMYLKLASVKFPNTQAAWKSGVSVPLYPSLTNDEIRRVVVAVRQALL